MTPAMRALVEQLRDALAPLRRSSAGAMVGDSAHVLCPLTEAQIAAANAAIETADRALGEPSEAYGGLK